MRKSKQLLCHCCRCVFGNYPLPQYEHDPGFPGEIPALLPMEERTKHHQGFSGHFSKRHRHVWENKCAGLIPVLQTFFLHLLVKCAVAATKPPTISLECNKNQFNNNAKMHFNKKKKKSIFGCSRLKSLCVCIAIIYIFYYFVWLFSLRITVR